jgi:hypothetical protein
MSPETQAFVSMMTRSARLSDLSYDLEDVSFHLFER